LLYKKITGNPNAPLLHKTPENYLLGSWQNHQRQFYKKGKLSPDRIKRLNEIGFIWMIVNVKPNRLGWDFWYKLTTEYKNEFGNPNAKVSYKTAEGYRLGSWQSHQRTKKEKLSIDQIRRLEEIGFTWEILEERFEKGFQETLFYKKSTGNPNAPLNYKTPEGYRFGKWQSHQRQFYNKGTLSSDRIRQLEEIGFTWDLLEEQFEKGFQETLLYKKSTGNPNAPASHKTAEGFRLGAWQNTKRVHYKKGKLFPDRIKRLEEIGFKWRSSD